MRDLIKDLELISKATPGPWTRNEKPSFGDWWVCSGGQHICLLPADKKGTYYGEMFRANSDFIAQAREGWPHAIERAIKAEAEVERLKKVYATTNDSWKKLQAENPRLHKAAEAARRVMDAVMAQPQDVKERNIALAWLDAVLWVVELDKEGTVER